MINARLCLYNIPVTCGPKVELDARPSLFNMSVTCGHKVEWDKV